MAKTPVPAIEGWFTQDANDPRLLGSQCTTCKNYFFPKESTFCRNPACDGNELAEVPLGRRGKLWSFTNNCYPPPAPYVATDPFEPYAIAAVELPEEKIVILGQVEPGIGVDQLEAGMEMELVLGPLYEDEEHEYLIWKWRPVRSASNAQSV